MSLILERRPEPSRLMTWASPLMAVLLTTLLAGLLFSLLGKDPVRGLSMFFIEPLANTRLVGEVLLKATPLVLCALGLAVCYRSNVWNIGAEGQFLLGAIFASGLALALADLGFSGPRGLHSPLVLLAGLFGGMVWAGITACLRDRFNANEILVSLMLVYVAQQLVNYLVFGTWKDPQGFNFPQTPSFEPSMLLPAVASGTRLHLGAVLALHLFQRRKGGAEELQHDRRVDVGDDAEAEEADLGDGAAAQGVDVAQQAVGRHGAGKGVDVDAGQAHVHADAGEHDES